MNKNSHNFWRATSMYLVLMMIFSPSWYSFAQVTPPEPAQDQAAFRGFTENSSAIQSQEQETTSQKAFNKLDPFLQNLSKNALALPEKYKGSTRVEQQSIIINLEGSFSAETLAQLKPYFVDGKMVAQPRNPSSGRSHLLSGLILPANLLKVASFPEVEKLTNSEPMRMENDSVAADDTQPKPGPVNWEILQANADALREGSLPWSEAKVVGDGRLEPASPESVDDWYEVSPMGPVKAEVAWERGFTGEGVQVAIIDDGIDFAHPDLIGAQSIYNSTVNPHLNGWPVVMDPFTLRAYFYDLTLGSTYISGGFPGTTLMDTSASPKLYNAGGGILKFYYTPRISYNTPGTKTNTYLINSTMSLSGVIHVGTHHDESLRDYIWGAQVAVLVTDPNIRGVYDTVYVDLNNDKDFQNEKPLRKANPNDPSTYNNMISYRDFDNDGKADLNGGMLYFIADGQHYVPGMDWLFGLDELGVDPPAAGSIIGLHGPWDSGYSHGTQCASNVVGSGQTDAYLPEFADLGGTPEGAVYGAAPSASLVAMNTAWGFSGDITYRDAYLLAAIGWDGIDQNGKDFLTGAPLTDTDSIQITTNSYGFSATFNDGWDETSLVIEDIMRNFAPYQQYMYSTGNGGPGYGTSAPPSPGLGIAVGASTEYGSTGWDSITYTQQINYNDVAAFSNNGPGARDGAGVDVLAGGAYAAGAEELNYYGKSYFNKLDGNLSWSTWGGTSRSSPVASGVLALIYQAYKTEHGVWPTAQTAKAILMSTSTDINQEVFKQGTGVVNADVGTAVAGGLYGVYLGADSSSWTPGDFRGVDAESFAHTVTPGSYWDKTFSLHNDSDTDVNVGIQTSFMDLIETQTFEFPVTPTMIAAESVNGSENRDNFYRAFNFFIPLHGFAENKITIPAETELMVVRQVFDYDQFDIDHNYAYDNRFYLTLYNWMDINVDGDLWNDKDGNGVVNFINDYDNLTGIDQEPQLAWDDTRNELDRWEYARYGYNRPNGNASEVSIQDPLNRNFDGIFIGLRHLYSDAGSQVATTLKYQVEFYKRSGLSWLVTDFSTSTVPAHGVSAFTARLNLPADIPPGAYQAAIEVFDPGVASEEVSYSANNIIIPVTIHVAAQLTDSDIEPLQIGGSANASYDSDTSYRNSAVRGYFDWSWREEAGDWRSFFVDMQNSGTTIPPYTAHVILKDEWEAPAPMTDIDTIVLGPVEHPSKSWNAGGGDPLNDGEPFNTYDEELHGPYSLDTVERSIDDRSGRATWRFNTSSDTNQEWLFFPFNDGLHEILQHNVLFEGDTFEKVFTKTLGLLYEDVTAFNINTYYNQGILGDVNIISTMGLNGMQTDAFLIEKDVENIFNEPLTYTGPGSLEWSYEFLVDNAISIELKTSSSNVADLDLYLYFWNGKVWEQRGASSARDAFEYIYLPDPEDGRWMASVDNYSGPTGTFNLEKLVLLRNQGITATIQPTGPILANTPVSIHVEYDANLVEGINNGYLYVGPPEAPQLKEIPITINRLPMKLGWVEKSIDSDLHFPGDLMHYTIELYNTFPDVPIEWDLVDVIPELTSFQSAEITCNEACAPLVYHPDTDTLTYNGTLPTSEAGFYTGFENGGAWPEGWTTAHLGDTSYKWIIGTFDPYKGIYHASIRYDSVLTSDEWIYSPVFAVTENDNQVEFWVKTDTEYPGATLKLHVLDEAGNWLETIWDLIQNEDWETNEYRQKVFSLAAYANQRIQLAWQYVGLDGNSVRLDEITLPGVLPAASIDLQVLVEEDPLLSGGQTITNIANLAVIAAFPQETQSLVSSSSQVDVFIGLEDLSDSYKEAPPTAISGDLLEYNIHLSNTGEGVAYLELVDPIPPGTSYVSHDPGSDYSFNYDVTNQRMVWNSSLSPGESLILTFTVRVDATLGVILNDASLTWNEQVMHLLAQTAIGYPVFLPIVIK